MQRKRQIRSLFSLSLYTISARRDFNGSFEKQNVTVSVKKEALWLSSHNYGNHRCFLSYKTTFFSVGTSKTGKIWRNLSGVPSSVCFLFETFEMVLPFAHFRTFPFKGIALSKRKEKSQFYRFLQIFTEFY